MGGRALGHGLFWFSCREQRLAGLLGPPHEIPWLQSHPGAPEGRGCCGLISSTQVESVLGAVWESSLQSQVFAVQTVLALSLSPCGTGIFVLGDEPRRQAQRGAERTTLLASYRRRL